MVATSGTAGRPRIVCHTWDALWANARAANARNPFGPGDSWHATLSWAHIGGLAVLGRVAVGGGVLSFGSARFDAQALVEPLARAGVTHLSVVPAMLHRMLEIGAPPAGVRCLLVGGAPTAPGLLAEARGAGWPAVATYGLTEAGSQVATHRAGGGLAGGFESRPGLPLLDGFDARTAPDGEIQLRGPSMMLGYLSRPDPFQPGGWLPTGDFGVVEVETPAKRVRVVGRRSERIISGGVNVDPVEVEEVLAAHPAVVDACVVGTSDPVWGEIVTAIIATRSGSPDEAVPGVEGWARARLSGARLPRRWWFVDTLPRLASGKLDRVRLRALAAERWAPGGERG